MRAMAGPGPRGKVSSDGDRATLTFVRRLDHPMAAVWRALTDPARRAVWFGPTTIDPRVGGAIAMDPEHPPIPAQAKRMTGRILVWDPPYVLEHEWLQGIVEPGVVRYELAPAPDGGGGTILTFTHRGLGLGNARGFVAGTHAHLDRLAAHLDGEPLPAWEARYAEVQPFYQ